MQTQAKLTLTFLEDEDGGVLIELEGDLDRPLLYLAAIEVLNQAIQDWFVAPDTWSHHGHTLAI